MIQILIGWSLQNAWLGYTVESIRDYFVAKSHDNRERQRKLVLEVAELKSKCEALKDSIDSNIGDYEGQLLETLDRI